jgi:hypothetical protein
VRCTEEEDAGGSAVNRGVSGDELRSDQSLSVFPLVVYITLSYSCFSHHLHQNAAERVGYEDDRPVLILLSKITNSNSLPLPTFLVICLSTKLLIKLITVLRSSTLDRPKATEAS